MIKSIFSNKSSVIVTLDDGKSYQSNTNVKEITQKVNNLYLNQNNINVKDELDKIFYPKHIGYKKVIENKSNSILTIRDGSAYMLDVSNLTVPQLLVDKILEAESRNDINAVTAYKNFWTLLSLNPNDKVRDNLFWFLDKWGMSICKSGLFVAYRNVHLKSEGVKYNSQLTEKISQYYYQCKNNSKNPKDYVVLFNNNEYSYTTYDNINKDDTIIGNLNELYNAIIYCNSDAGTVYTDDHTKTFKIRLGHIVSMPRKDVDEDVEATCSRGLHVAGRDWLKHNYCGNIGIKCLVNPANVCSCPKQDDYGKLRTCAYYPIQVINFTNEGKIDDTFIPDGFEVDFINKISYTGTINNVDNDNYKLDIPDFIQHENLEDVFVNLRNIADSIDRRN
jgi:hypothetical protein